MSEIRKVIAHSCFQKGKGFLKDQPLSPRKCNCRQRVSVQEAAVEVSLGLAQYVVATTRAVEVEETCDLCTEALRKTCKKCLGTGLIKVQKEVEVRGQDIIRTVSLDGKKNILTTQVKRSPTIERAHIERAIEGNQAEQLRIELYGASCKDFIKSLISGSEPEDNPKTGTGRKFDYGRSV